MTGSGALAAFQDALAKAVSGEALDEAELALLGVIATAPGLALTSRIRRSWCEARAAGGALLTLSALSPTEREQHLAAWLDRGGGARSFVHKEAEAFLDFLAGRLGEMSHAAALCRLERAVLRARDHVAPAPPAVPDNGSLLCRSEGAAIVEFRAPVDEILAALDGKAPWPPTTGVHPILIAPRLAGHARPATLREVALWRSARSPVQAGQDLETARALVDTGALVTVLT